MTKIKIPELLCPAGNLESFYAAVNNGADAVYLGGQAFNARNYANNFSEDILEELIDYAHRRNVKVHVTLNTLYKNRELNEVLKFAEKLYCGGADAFIMQDMGAAAEVKRLFPEIKLHASTQMTVHSLGGAKYMEESGFDRVVLSRELSLEELWEISSNIHIETESFVHGALCVCYSGQCLMSSLIGGRSGNRGRCAQPCRMQYDLADKRGQVLEKGYLLSPRDIMTLDIMEEIIKSGVSSLKIEGRMKSPEYVGIVTKGYREYLDNITINEKYKNQKTVDDVTQIFNRGGTSSSGYYNSFSGSSMMSTQTPKSTGLYVGSVLSYEPPKNKNAKGKCVIKTDMNLIPGDGIEIWTEDVPHVGTNISKQIEAGDRFIINITGDINIGDKVYRSFDKTLADEGKRLYSQDTKKFLIKGSLDIQSGRPAKITLSHKDIMVEMEGDMVQKADKHPLSEEKIIAQFSKTGSTTYRIQYENNIIDNEIYMGVSSINNLRRAAVDEFDRLYVESFKREGVQIPKYAFKAGADEKEISVQANNLYQLLAAVKNGVKRVYFPYKRGNEAEIKNAVEIAEKYNSVLYLALPKICRNEDEKNLLSFIEEIEGAGIQGYLVSTYGELEMIKHNSTLPVMLDYSFNIFNSLSAAYFMDQGFDITLSQELNFHEMNDIEAENGELVVHGKQIMMLTHQCPVGLYAGKKQDKKFCSLKENENEYYLIDRKKAELPVYTDCSQCISYILNPQTLCMVNKFHDLKKTSVKYLRLVFHKETEETVEQTVRAYMDMVKKGYSEDENLLADEGSVTYGHFYRGVE